MVIVGLKTMKVDEHGCFFSGDF